MSIKLICLDFDGTIVDTRHTHFLALNDALVKNGFAAIPDADFQKWDGLSTKTKLSMLAAEGKIPAESFATIEEDKQEKTVELYQNFKRDDKIYSMLNTLTNMGYKIALVTNGVPETVHILLNKMEISQFFDEVITNADGKPKPAPDLYLKAMKDCGEKPTNTLVVEDGDRGIAAAKAAGITNIIKVKSPEDLSTIFLLTKIMEMSNLR